ncbi:MAG: hypothetical protein MK116_01050 [Phycisphaerales bacterium]|nr:hypothetical protein [Phycisphaerales bacterium]
MSFKDRLKHAFGVEKIEEIDPTEYQKEIVDTVCKAVVRRRMTVPALMALEMSRPLNFVASQVIHFFRPIVAVVLDTAGIEAFANFLEHRGSVEYLARRLDYWEDRGVDDDAEKADPGGPQEKDVLPEDAAPDDDSTRS